MSTREHYQRGMAAYVAGNDPEAAAWLEPIADRDGGPIAAVAAYYLSKVHHRLGCGLLAERRFAAAASHFSAAARFNHDNMPLAERLAACSLGECCFEAASDQFEKLLRHDPGCVETRVRLALSQCKAGQVWRAVETIRRGIELAPRDAELHYQLGVLTAAQGDLPAAQTQFEAAISCDPQHARAYERLAQCCSVADRHERALRLLERAARIEPDHPRIAWQLTLAAPERAARIVSIAPAARTRPQERALERLARTVLDEPDFIDAFTALPPADADEEIFGTLAATLRHALERHPGYADLHYRSGLVHQRLGRPREAIEAAETAVRINPRYVNALILLAQLYARTDRDADAVTRLEAAIRAGADYPDVHYLMGRLCQRLGSIERARSSYRRAIELNADYRDAREALASLAA